MQDIINKIEQLGAKKAAVLNTDEIPFAPELRKLCESNQCGGYGKNWTCPPHVGDVYKLMEDLKGYKYAIVYQTVWKLEDSFDFEGMEAGKKGHEEITKKITEELKKYFKSFLQLSAGGCKICEKCSIETNEPCRFPNEAVSSLEAYGIHVSELSKKCGMLYINGVDTVTYFGAYFIK